MLKDPIGPNGGHDLDCNACPLTIIMPFEKPIKCCRIQVIMCH